MNEAVPFVVTFRFETPPIVRGPCTLDAVLGGELARRVECREEAIARTPLVATERVHHGSSLILLGDTGATRPATALRKTRAALLRIDPEWLEADGRPASPGPAKNALDTFEARVCAGGAWLGTGPIDEVRRLLAPLFAIGKRRAWGWGMIEPDSLAIEPVDADPATWGLVTGPGDRDFATERIEPRRPLPLALFRRLGGEPLEAVLAVTRVRQPYYDPASAPEPAVVART